MNVFISYAHEDEAMRDELAKHLSVFRQQGLITDWHDRQIRAGQTWQHEIEKNLKQADVVLLLVSPDFLGSHYCSRIELPLAIELHRINRAIPIIPIILRPCVWEHSPVAQFQVLPHGGIPVTMWHSRDEAFTDIVKGLREVLTWSPQADVTFRAGRSVSTMTSEMIARARAGSPSDIDFLMQTLTEELSPLEQLVFDYALSLANSQAGRSRLHHYLLHGTSPQRLAAAVYLKTQSGADSLEAALPHAEPVPFRVATSD